MGNNLHCYMYADVIKKLAKILGLASCRQYSALVRKVCPSGFKCNFVGERVQCLLELKDSFAVGRSTTEGRSLTTRWTSRPPTRCFFGLISLVVIGGLVPLDISIHSGF